MELSFGGGVSLFCLAPEAEPGAMGACYRNQLRLEGREHVCPGGDGCPLPESLQVKAGYNRGHPGAACFILTSCCPFRPSTYIPAKRNHSISRTRPALSHHHAFAHQECTPRPLFYLSASFSSFQVPFSERRAWFTFHFWVPSS